MTINVCAMILAAGRGERMRPLTDQTPKPLIEIRGKPLIVHHIEKLVAIGVERIVINVSYRAEQIQATLGDGSRFGCELCYSVEDTPLETGGGVARASAYFDKPQFILASADVYCEYDFQRFLVYRPIEANGTKNSRNAHFVMVHPISGQPGGEFAIDENGRLNRGHPRLTLANIGIIKTSAVQHWPRGERFPLLPFYSEWVAAGQVTGERYDGLWCNVTTPDDVLFLNQN